MEKKEQVKLMQEALDAYRTDKTKSKALLASMKELSLWLKEQEK